MIPNKSEEVNAYEVAKANKSKRYYTGRPCTRGHITERLTSSKECVECKREREKIKYQEKSQSEYRKQLYAVGREEKIQKQKEYTRRRYAEVVAYGRSWREQNKNRIKRYMKERAGLYAFHAACRRARVKQATPAWAELEHIKTLYEQAASLTVAVGVEHAVDHIIPITNDLVCGLHCVANLQIITREENATKSNKFQIE